jgi:cyanobactin maturation PatA/PatG family protease
LLATAIGCDVHEAAYCRRLLAGRLNISGALNYLSRKPTMSATELTPSVDAVFPPEDSTDSGSDKAATLPAEASPALPAASMEASACGCGCKAGGSLVYALGQVGYDLVNEARLDSLSQKMAGLAGGGTAERVRAFNAALLLGYLNENPWDAAAIEWTLSVDGTTIYAIRPSGAYAASAYETLRQFLGDQLTQGAERVSIPGRLSGRTRLLMGQTVPVIEPDLRGMYSWSTQDFTDKIAGPAPPPTAPAEETEVHAQKSKALRGFLDRVYHGMRNLGTLSSDRALNFAATNAFNAERVFHEAALERMELDSIGVSPSPICRPGSDCWDVELYFFYPERHVQTVRRVHRFTVDVSDVVPVTVGPVRSWFVR